MSLRNKLFGKKSDGPSYKARQQHETLETDFRILFIEKLCPFCRMYMQHVGRVNSMLPVDKQIDIVDAGDDIDDRADIFKVRVTPTLYLDGVQVEGVTSEGYVKGFLVGFLENELMGMHGYNIHQARSEIPDELLELDEPREGGFKSGLKKLRSVL